MNNPTFEEIGHFRIKGVSKSQKNWMIYAFIEKNKVNLLVEDYMNKGELLSISSRTYSFPYSYGNFILFKDLNKNEFEKTLNQVRDYLSIKYKSLKWFINKDKVDKIKIILRLQE